jgi:hypothetical protein
MPTTTRDPEIQITSPAPGATFDSDTSDVQITVSGTASCTDTFDPGNDDGSGTETYDRTDQITNVEVDLGDGQGFRPASKNATTWANWTYRGSTRTRTPLTITAKVTVPNPPGGIITSIDTVAVTVLPDITAPFLNVNPPAPILAGSPGSQLIVPISGEASDAQSGMKSLSWTVTLPSGGPGTSGALYTPPNWSNWTANVTVPAQIGTYSVKFVATDQAGNSTMVPVKVYVSQDVTPVSADFLGLWSYLTDLLAFAKRYVVNTGSTDVTTSIDAAFYQRFSELVEDEPLRQVRICIEVLRRYFAGIEGISVNQQPYRQAAYEMLLAQIGTTYEEIRLSRTADEPARAALAARLGIDATALWPSAQDNALFLSPEQLAGSGAEAMLEQLFGLRSTTRDPLTTPPEPDLRHWQRDHLKMLWVQQDHPVGPDAALQAPIIDPDLIRFIDPTKAPAHAELSDIVYAANNPAVTLWNSRQNWVQGLLTEFRGDSKAGETDLDRFKRLVNAALAPSTVDDLIAADGRRQTGADISAELQGWQLCLAAFSRLILLYKLAQPGPLLSTEWEDVYSILTQVKKQRAYDGWREEEANTVPPLTLSGSFFQIPALSAASGVTLPALPRWRATESTRRQWQDKLRGRISQMQAVEQALQAAVTTTEAATLPLLRDALIAGFATHANANVAIAADWLTERLMIDVKSSGEQATTRLTQAIETLQSILFSLRSGRFEDMEANLGPNPAASWQLGAGKEGDFDIEWAWMGSYANWRGAMLVFFFPENLLQPTLREDQTGDFQAFITNLRNNQPLTPAQVKAAADDFLTVLKSRSAGPIKLADLLSPFGSYDQLLAAKQQDMYNSDPQNRTLWTFLDDLFYFVPIYFALWLVQAGRFTDALAWFRRVYADNLPRNQRKLAYRLQREEGPATIYAKPDTLLLDLNPHSIVGSMHTNRPNAYTRFTLQSMVQCFLQYADAEFSTDSPESIARARTLYISTADLLNLPEMQLPMSDATGQGSTATVANPLLDGLRQHAELNLFKLRSGRNIAGMQRPPEPVTSQVDARRGVPTLGGGGQLQVPAPTALRPTAYRYATLIERTRQLVTIAQQVETSFLSTLERQDPESYSAFKANQDLEVANASVIVQGLRVDQATDGVTLADLQKQKSESQVDRYNALVSGDISKTERSSLDLMWAEAGLQVAGGTLEAIATLQSGFSFKTLFESGSNINQSAAQSLSFFASATGTTAAALEKIASYERRRWEWQWQASQAEQDVGIGAQQKQIALAQQTVALQEQSNAQLQASHAQATVDYLAKKFLNVDLYEWMSRVLERVYRYFLQQATSMARLAQTQLAFERQEPPLSIIQADYWQDLSQSDATASANGTSTDRRGLTGSARLLQDI